MDAPRMIATLVDALIRGIHGGYVQLKTLTYHEPLADVVADVGGSEVRLDDIGYDHADRLRNAQHTANENF